MEEFTVDADPGHLVRWLLDEQRTGRRDLRISATRSYIWQPTPDAQGLRLGDAEREDLTEVTLVGVVEVAATAPHGGWVLRLRAEDPIGPRTPEDEAVQAEEEEIDLAAFDEEIVRPGRAVMEVTAEVDDDNAGRRLRRLLQSIETDHHRTRGAAGGHRPTRQQP